MLIGIKDYFNRHGVVTLNDLAVHFQVAPDAMRGMLGHWLRKGKVRKHSACCTRSDGCGSCDAALSEWYEWVEPRPTPMAR